MLFDLHVHTNFSPCSILSVDAVLAKARRLGLDGVCITDHNSTKAETHIQEGMQADGLVVLVGQEYATSDGDFLLFGPGRHAPAGMPAPELLERTNRAGGVAVAAHPFRSDRACDPALLDDRACGVVEGINGRCSPEENRLAAEWARGHGVPMTGGSDAHCLEELAGVVTRFFRPVLSHDDLVRALKSGAYQAHCLGNGADRLLSQPRTAA